MKAFMSQGLAGCPFTAGIEPASMNSAASQSSSSGWLGYSAWLPRFSLVFTRPVPKNRSHIRFTHTRAVSGLSRATIHFASDSRSAFVPSGNRGRNAGSAASTLSPRLSYSPRLSTKASRGVPSFITMALGSESRNESTLFLAVSRATSARRIGPSTFAR